MCSTNRKLIRIILYFFLSFFLCCSCGGCLDWLKNLCCICGSNTSNDGIGKLNKKREYLYIIGDIYKCSEVLKKVGEGSWSKEKEIETYNKTIKDDLYNDTFIFYLCGHEVETCSRIHTGATSYFFFFVDITDSNSLDNLLNSLDSFKENFCIDAGAERFFLILLKTNSQGEQRISVEEAEKFANDNGLIFFGEIDIANITWSFRDKILFYKTIGGIIEYYGGCNDYKLGKRENLQGGKFYYNVEEEKDIWGMFLCGVKRRDINSYIINHHLK